MTDEPKEKERRCSVCGSTDGHNRRSCPNRNGTPSTASTKPLRPYVGVTGGMLLAGYVPCPECNGTGIEFLLGEIARCEVCNMKDEDKTPTACPQAKRSSGELRLGLASCPRCGGSRIDPEHRGVCGLCEGGGRVSLAKHHEYVGLKPSTSESLPDYSNLADTDPAPPTPR